MHKFSKYLVTVLFLAISVTGFSAETKKKEPVFSDKTFTGLKLRSLGPAFMSGRIADIAIHPNDNNLWYVAVGSGGVWKTKNAGTTWLPVFDDQTSYSIGCVTIDPGNPHVVWVGTGENVGGRHVGYGDGVYRSIDGGESWENMGLKKSQHISKIIVHPADSDILWIAAQGPLWSKGGERGLYKTTDGGKTWKKTLGDATWTGVTEVVIDSRNPDVLYAATWQRHRNVAAYMGGGPGSGLHRSTDGGETWQKLTKGLPESNMGKIGLAISPQNPDVLYAAIELDRRTGAVYRSSNRGASWVKGAEAVGGGTGPHYYQELYASPHQFDRIYMADNRMRVSDDGGKIFRRMKKEHKHGDDHALVFRSDDPDYLLVGTDGGLYESFDLAESWRYIANLPVTQYYKVAVDDAAPFYNIYGGTQDNSTQGGPSRTDNVHGISNADWRVILDWDGHQPATEPGNPNIVYAERQQGFLSRIDMTTGEQVHIQPQPAAGEGPERYNWDAPILVSPHSPTRIYFASHRVWKSVNRGDEWTAISGDLTRNQERITLPIMGATQSWDAAWDISAMSTYNTITSLAESPLQEGLLYAGTDDGLIQVTENGGDSWTKIEVGSLPGVPATAFVNDIKADLHDANTVYVVLDNHKFGDLNPYVLKSTNRGKSWRSIKNNLPARTLVWRIVQDHVKPDLMFTATEFGVYVTVDGGARWSKLSGGVPTISFRDLAIQRRENDLVAASFGRGFYVLDDYSALRKVSAAQLKKEATLFPTRNAWWYVPRPVLGFSAKGSQGGAYFTAPNPPFGAVFTYHLAEGLTTAKDARKKAEKASAEKKASVRFPGWDKVEAEEHEAKPEIWLTVKDSDGNVVRRVQGKTEKGFHRVAWDLRYPALDPIIDTSQSDNQPQGMLAAPGDYTVTLSKQVNGTTTDLSEPAPFKVERLRKGALEGAEPKTVAAFWKELADLQRSAYAAYQALEDALKRTKALQLALTRTPAAPGNLDKQLHGLRSELQKLDSQLNGNPAKNQIGENNDPTIGSRLFMLSLATGRSTYGPTPAHKRQFEITSTEFKELGDKLDSILSEQIPTLEKALQDAGAPWVKGQPLPK